MLRTRAEYRTNSTKLFRDYYLQFSNLKTERLVLSAFTLKELSEAYAKDPFLNNLGGNKNWDKLEPAHSFIVDYPLLKTLGEVWALSTSICILKCTAFKLVEQSIKNTETLNQSK